jgi:uncharacterized protein (TIGR02217 family)
MFIEDRLLDWVAYGFRGGPRYAVTKVTLRSLRTRRNAETSQPLYRFVAPYDRIKPEHHNEVISAFHVCLASTHGFRLRDRADYQLDDVEIGTATGITDETMQIVKPYTFGGITRTRDITKPVDSVVFSLANGYTTDSPALTVTADDVALAFTCNYSTGMLTFTANEGEIIRVSGEFDVPVFFDQEELDFQLSTYRAHSCEIVLLEDRGA